MCNSPFFWNQKLLKPVVTNGNLLKYIYSLTEFSGESWKLLQLALIKREFKKIEFLLIEGQVCSSLFYIDKGYSKSYYEIDGVAKNSGYFFENDIATNINSFSSGQKSEYNIIACDHQFLLLVLQFLKLRERQFLFIGNKEYQRTSRRTTNKLKNELIEFKY